MTYFGGISNNVANEAGLSEKDETAPRTLTPFPAGTVKEEARDFDALQGFISPTEITPDSRRLAHVQCRSALLSGKKRDAEDASIEEPEYTPRQAPGRSTHDTSFQHHFDDTAIRRDAADQVQSTSSHVNMQGSATTAMENIGPVQPAATSAFGTYPPDLNAPRPKQIKAGFPQVTPFRKYVEGKSLWTWVWVCPLCSEPCSDKAGSPKNYERHYDDSCPRNGKWKLCKVQYGQTASSVILL